MPPPVEPGAARVEGKLRLVVHNRERAGWSELVLRVYPQAGHGTSLRVEDVRVDVHQDFSAALRVYPDAGLIGHDATSLYRGLGPPS